MNGITKSTAVFYKGDGIRANAVVPGGVVTNLEASFKSEHAAGVTGPAARGALGEQLGRGVGPRYRLRRG